MTKNKNLFQKSLQLWLQGCFYTPNFAAFCSKEASSWQNLHYTSGKASELKMVIFNIFIWSFNGTKQKSILKMKERSLVGSALAYVSKGPWFKSGPHQVWNMILLNGLFGAV
jgi:hypothetical protein